MLEAVDAAVARIGSDRVAIRLSPFGQVSDMPAYEVTTETYLYLAKALSERKLAYVHLMDQQQFGSLTFWPTCAPPTLAPRSWLVG